MKGCNSKYTIFLGIFLVELALILVANSQPVESFGVATPYFTNDTVNLEPGQSFAYTIKVQNTEDLSFKIQIKYTSDNDIAVLNNTDFFITAKSIDNPYTFIVTIPNISLPETRYSLDYSVRPIMNNSGQIPMSVEIKRSAHFRVVDKNGQGYFAAPPANKDKILRDVLSFFKKSYVYIAAFLLILVMIYVLTTLWHTAKKMSDTKNIQAPFTISDAKSTEDLVKLLRIMPDHQFNNYFIRKEYSEKFKELKEEHLSKKVLTEKKKDILKILQ